MKEDDLWDLSDEALEAAFKEAKSEGEVAEHDIEEEIISDDTVDVTDESEEDIDSEIVDVEDESGQDQPDGDIEESDHNDSDESESDDVDEDNTEEAEEANPDGDAKAEETESSEETEEEEDKPQPTRLHSFRANGKDYEFSSEEIVDQFPKMFGKAMDYTKKMQTIKPWRKTIDAIEDAKLSHEDVGLMIDVLKGDKAAVTEVLKRTGVDALDLDTESDSNYVSKNYGRDADAIAISDIAEELSNDVEYATTQRILGKEWDERSWDVVAKDPEMIRLLHADVKSGMYAKLQPNVEKLKVYDNGSKPDIEYYKLAAKQYFDNEAKQQAVLARKSESQNAKKLAEKASKAESDRLAKAKADSDRRAKAKEASNKRKAAAPSKSASTERNVSDYLDDSDEAFDEWYKSVQDSV